MRAPAVVFLSLLAGAQQGAPNAPGAPAEAPPPSPLAQQRRVTTRYDDFFRKYSKRYFGPTFDWRRFKAQAMAESDLVPTARSGAGARGLMQLMPSTYSAIASVHDNYKAINDPQSNIAAGIEHDRDLWMLWENYRVAGEDRLEFMFGSYNAGEGTILRARARAKKSQLDPEIWQSVVVVAPKVPRWRYRETLGYVTTIAGNYAFLTPAPITVASPR